MATLTNSEEVGTRDALLAHHGSQDGEYSMTGYFLTFVSDIYGLFKSLPVVARWVVCLVLFYVAVKLLSL